MASASSGLGGLHQRAEALEVEKSQLKQRLTEQEVANDGAGRTLEAIRRGDLPRRGWILWLVLPLLLAVAVGVFSYRRQQQEQVPQTLTLQDTFIPHLLVTSQPPGVRVTLDGRERGVTPLLLELRDPRQEHQLLLQAAGHRPYRRTLRLAAAQGMHVQVTMTPATPAAEGTPAEAAPSPP